MEKLVTLFFFGILGACIVFIGAVGGAILYFVIRHPRYTLFILLASPALFMEEKPKKGTWYHNLVMWIMPEKPIEQAFKEDDEWNARWALRV